MKKLLIAVLGIPIIAIMINLWNPILVKASTTENWASSESRLRQDQQGTQTWGSFNSTPHTYNPTYPVSAIQFRVKATNGLDSQNSYIIKFGYKPTPQSLGPGSIEFRKGGDSSSTEEINCTGWGYNNNGYNINTCTFTPRENYSNSEYLIITIYFYEAYQTSIVSYMYPFEERVGTNAVITQTGDQITNEINIMNENITSVINNTTDELKEAITESNQICNLVDKNYIELDNYQLTSNGGTLSNNLSGVTRYINIEQATITELEVYAEGYLNRFCFYGVNKDFISCQDNAQINTITIPNNAVYFRSTIVKNANKPKYKICQNGNQALINKDHNYTAPDINNEVNQHEQEEETLMNELTFNTNTLNIPNTIDGSEYIWNCVSRFYTLLSGFWITILSLGIIRMVVGR